MEQRVINVFFALLRFEIKGMGLSEDVKSTITAETLIELYKIAKKHDLAHLIGDALDKNGLLPDGSDVKKRFVQERNMAVYRCEQLQYELNCICATLESAGIPFIPLKGSVLRHLYPEPWMRTSCDIDVLVQAKDLRAAIAALKNGLAYITDEKRTSHDVPLYSPSGVLLELHFSLLEDEERDEDALSRVWHYAFAQEGFQYYCAISKEAFYAYHIAHMMKHFEIGGCGLKPFIDLWVLDEGILEQDSTQEVLSVMGASKFADVANRLSKAMAGVVEYDPYTFIMQQYVFRGGVYGSKENLILSRQTKQGGKGKYVWRRFFPPYKTLATQYPFLKKCSICYPFYILRRWMLLLFSKKVRSNSKQELKIIKNLERNKQITQEELFKELGIR